MDKHQNASFPFLSSLIACLMAIVYLLVRYPFETDFTVPTKILGISLFFLNAPYVVHLYLSKRKAADFYSLNIFVVVSLLLLFVIAGIMNVTFLAYPIVILGATGFLITSNYYLRRLNRRKILSPIMASILVLWLAGSVWEGRMLTPLTIEKVVAGFYNNPKDLNYGLDNLFHMSIAQMIKTYNVPSTGLDELPYIPYHFGSHFIFAQLSQFMDISVLDAYNAGFAILFVPLFFHVAFIIFQQFRQLAGSYAKFDEVFWVLLFTVFVGFLSIDPSGFAYRTGLAWNSLIKSESYLISLLFFFIFLSIVLIPSLRDKVFNISWAQLALSIFILILVGLCKISTMFILDIIIGYLFLRWRLFRSIKGNVLLACAVVASLGLAYLLNDPRGPSGSYSFLHFYETFIYSRFHFFIALYFLWTFAIIVVCAVLYSRKIPFNTILLEIQVLIAGLGFLPGMLMRIEGGSAHYFSDIQHWTAFFFLAYYSTILRDSIKHKAMVMLGYGLGGLLILLASANCFYSFGMLARDNYATKEAILRNKIRHVSDITTREMYRKRETFFTAGLKSAILQIPSYHKIKALQSLDSLTGKQNTILYIEDKDWFEPYLQCYKYPFLVTSMTGISLLNGFSLNDCYWGGYGVEYYQDIATVEIEKDLCAAVKNPIFHEIIFYNIDHESYRILQCDDR